MSRSADVLLWFLAGLFYAEAILELPDISSNIDTNLTQELEIDHFFSYWDVFKNDNTVKTSDQVFTILVPKNSAKIFGINSPHENYIKQIILDHIVLGSIINVTNLTKELSFETQRGRTIHVRRKEDRLLANDIPIYKSNVPVRNGVLIILESYLFLEEYDIRRNVSQELPDDIGENHIVKVKEEPAKNATFVDNVLQVLSYLKSGVRVFQHFLSRSNVSSLLKEGEEYTVFVPTDHAFHRWHPIDWGFYPFSVPEFTESVITNHFVKGIIKQSDIKDEDTVTTLGGRKIIFRKTPALMINGVSVVKGDTPITRGNIMFTSEVLFVNESVVSRLHQQHRDKETPPLLAFPWFGAQFLSHAFLALERDRRFSHITRFLNLADLAPYVSGTGYSFFVPVDTAFEEIGLDKMPDNYLSNGDGLQILLNHFVKGRLYDKDLKNGSQLMTLGNSTIKIQRQNDQVRVNEATIVESEVFVYNLGTMFYIDKILFVKKELLPNSSIEPHTTAKPSTTMFDIETVPQEILEPSGLQKDILLGENEEVTETFQKVTTQVAAIK